MGERDVGLLLRNWKRTRNSHHEKTRESVPSSFREYLEQNTDGLTEEEKEYATQVYGISTQFPGVE